MSNIPTMRRRTPKFRGPTSSSDHNANMEDIFYDDLVLHNITNNFDLKITEVQGILYIENKFLQVKMKSLQDQLAQLQQQYNEIQNGLTEHTARAFVSEFYTDPSNRITPPAFLDREHGLATLALSGDYISKVYIKNDLVYNDLPQVVVPSTFTVNVDPPGDWFNIIENSVMNAFNGDGKSYWVRRVALPLSSSINELDATLTMKLPDNIISNRDCNTIYIHPFPMGTIDVLSIEYRLTGDWQPIPGWRGQIEDAESIKFCFENLEIAELRIKLRQRHWVEDNYQKVFYLGAQEIGVFYADYQAKQAQLSMNFDLLGTGAKTITGIIPHFANELALKDSTPDKRNLISFNIYTIGQNGELVPAKDTLPAVVTGNKIVVRATMNIDPNNGATPALEWVDLNYSTGP